LSKNFFDKPIDRKYLAMEVTLKPIPGYPGYYASSEGTIYSLVRPEYTEPKELKGLLNSAGYLRVKVHRKFKFIHRLVALAWHGEPPTAKAEVRHLDSDSKNNRPENLRWARNHLENMKDRMKNGRYDFKLSPKKVRIIRQLLVQGALRTALAKRFNVSRYAIYCIAECLTWKRPGCGITYQFLEWQAKRWLSH
jgi:hypothetical protein